MEEEQQVGEILFVQQEEVDEEQVQEMGCDGQQEQDDEEQEQDCDGWEEELVMDYV